MFGFVFGNFIRGQCQDVYIIVVACGMNLISIDGQARSDSGKAVGRNINSNARTADDYPPVFGLTGYYLGHKLGVLSIVIVSIKLVRSQIRVFISQSVKPVLY